MRSYTGQQKEDIREAFEAIDREKLAEDLGSTLRTVDQMACGLLIVGAGRAALIEVLTEGKITKELLRPDIFKPAPVEGA
jgi:DNA-binding transcriptional regulator YdaS (Cro superfamily)